MVVSVHHKQPAAWYILPILSLQRDTYVLMQDCPCRNQIFRSKLTPPVDEVNFDTLLLQATCYVPASIVFVIPQHLQEYS